MNEKLTDDAAWATAVSIMECLRDQSGETEDRDQFAAIFERVKAGILVYGQLAERRESQLAPSRN